MQSSVPLKAAGGAVSRNPPEEDGFYYYNSPARDTFVRSAVAARAFGCYQIRKGGRVLGGDKEFGPRKFSTSELMNALSV